MKRVEGGKPKKEPIKDYSQIREKHIHIHTKNQSQNVMEENTSRRKEL